METVSVHVGRTLICSFVGHFLWDTFPAQVGLRLQWKRAERLVTRTVRGLAAQLGERPAQCGPFWRASSVPSLAALGICATSFRGEETAYSANDCRGRSWKLLSVRDSGRLPHELKSSSIGSICYTRVVVRSIEVCHIGARPRYFTSGSDCAHGLIRPVIPLCRALSFRDTYIMGSSRRVQSFSMEFHMY